MKKVQISLAVLLGLAGTATPALAYVGPGAGLSLLGALWGLLIAVIAALGFVVLWPLRRFLFKRKRPEPSDFAEGEPPDGATVSKPPSS